jgi:glycosyltransferase involved in cell wall biosynthesis
MPQISFIMPVYNTRTEWLKRAVNSVRKQTVEDWELLLIDDGSKFSEFKSDHMIHC